MNQTKKLSLSLVVTMAFVFYVLYERVGLASPADNVNVIAPISLQTPSQAQTLASALAAPTPTPKPTPATSAPKPVPTPTPPPTPKPLGQYRDGTYVGSVADAYYGNLQVEAVISGGKISDVIFLQYPSDRSTSRMINSQAMPYLKLEAIQAQSANVDIVSGATASSGAFQQSLAMALAQAKN